MKKKKSHLTILLDRLELIAATKQLLLAEDNLEQLAGELEADVPSNWPMPLYDDDARAHFIHVLDEDPEAVGWTSWYILLNKESGSKILIGAVGACGPPDENGTIVIGYSLLDQFHGLGFATEALSGFLGWTRQHHGLHKVIADTFPQLKASIRVLEKCGFISNGSGEEEDAVRFELLVQ